MKHLLTLLDLDNSEIVKILDLADQLKYEQKHGIEHKHLSGKTLGMIFQKASTRTRVSFEVGMAQLGGYPLFLSSSDLQIGRGEDIKDTARVLSRYLDAIMIRTYDQKDVEDLAAFGSIPVINGLTDDYHPCQVLADLMTIREKKKSLSGLKLCYLGDGNNMANSLIIGCLKSGMKVSIACPSGYEPKESVLKFAKEYRDSFSIGSNPQEEVKNADVVYTDVWASMGQESQAQERVEKFKEFQVNEKLLSLAKPDSIVLHCLPAHRGEEISESTLEANADSIFDQAENRLHAQKAVLVMLMK